jgi:alkanesulfonate monooxygenase SsuD/methylene tetrahydromethanopterin reductase-like flavin-dependent oxidoreductase (luciferase family)
MRFGIFQTVQWPAGTTQHDRYREALDQAVLAESLGFESVWMTEHHFTRHGITSDPLVLLAHLAARTERIRLGTAVSVLPFHDPVRLAESAALVDHLSNGRLDVGIGRGYQWTEYHGFGFELGEGTDRFEEALEVLVRSWTTHDAFAFDGKFHRYEAASPQPKPLQQPHPPIWHATASDAGMARCVANEWGILLAQGTPPATVVEQVAAYHRALAAAGKGDRLDRVALARGMFCAATTAAAEATFLTPYLETLELAARVSASPVPSDAAAPHNPFQLDDRASLGDTVICGDPDRCAEAVARLRDIGIDYVLVFVNLGGLDHDRVTRSLTLFANEVMPRFRE